MFAMQKTRLLAALLACSQLQGCLFFFTAPSTVFSSANTCVGAGAYVGQSIYNRGNGKTGKLTQLHGRSDRCQDGAIPILATVEYAE